MNKQANNNGKKNKTVTFFHIFTVVRKLGR